MGFGWMRLSRVSLHHANIRYVYTDQLLPNGCKDFSTYRFRFSGKDAVLAMLAASPQLLRNLAAVTSHGEGVILRMMTEILCLCTAGETFDFFGFSNIRRKHFRENMFHFV